MRRVVGVVGLVLLLALASVPIADAKRAPKLDLKVGVGRADVTPPAFDPVADAVAFPLCPAAIFSGLRSFALQEPYADVDGSGEFAYGEPFCDANHNGRYDGLYLSSGTNHLLHRVHDPIDARAIAFSDGSNTAVLVSVVNQGLFENYSHRIRDRVEQLRPGVTDIEVSANHNESSPDAIGIYGAPDIDGVTGARSGIDDYYMDFLIEKVADAAVAAYDDLQPAVVRATTFPLPADVRVQLSNNFPTTDDEGNPAAIDPKVRMLTATTAHGAPLFELVNLAAHNQEIGHSGAGDLAHEISADWPGALQRELERTMGGMAVFLAGDNGSEEDPETVPPVSVSTYPECTDGCYAQAEATGETLAHAALGHTGDLERVRPGSVTIRRDEFFVPLENNLFRVAGAAGLFGDRVGYVNGIAVAPGLGNEFRTEVGVITVGPDVQVLANPGEAFPALMLGSPWGIDEAGCPDRPNPPAPAWHAAARWRFEAGLANDMIGYLLPAWGFSSEPGTYTTTCFNDQDNRDPKGHQHKLEDESVGPTAGNLVAEHLTALLDGGPDPAITVTQGRFLLGDGTTTRRASGAVGVVLADGRVVRAEAGVQFIDYDGAPQPGPDLSTRGVQMADGQEVFLDVYPLLDPP